MKPVLSILTCSAVFLAIISVPAQTVPVFLGPAAACLAPDNGNGSADLPGPCPFVVTGEQMHITDGLPFGSEILLTTTFENFMNITYPTGGSLGGGKIDWQGDVIVTMAGTGALSGYSRIINIPVTALADVGPHLPGSPVQSFPSEMLSLQGSIFGDPDFNFLSITMGTDNGLASSGQNSLTRLPGGDWNVESFFDVVYSVEFLGAPGSPLEGFSGITVDTTRLSQGDTIPPTICKIPFYSVKGTLPPLSSCPCRAYHTPVYGHILVCSSECDLLYTIPDISDIELQSVAPDPSTGGETQNYLATTTLQLEGDGTLSGLNRTILIPLMIETHTGPRTPGAPVEDFSTELIKLEGQISGDPDFDLLRVTAGSDFGMPSPGHTTLTLHPDGDWNLDTFYDVYYRIEFVGAPGSLLEGLSGSATGRHDFRSGAPSPFDPGETRVPDNGLGTVPLPPPLQYISSGEQFKHTEIGSLVLNTQLVVDSFSNITHAAGDSAAPDTAGWDALLHLSLAGTDSIAGYYRYLSMPVSMVVTHGPPQPGEPIQTFETELIQLQGEIFGDPDFDTLRIRAGSMFGLPPSPGHSTIVQLPGGNFGAPSVFDVFIEIHISGASLGFFGPETSTTTDTFKLVSGRPLPRPPAIVPDNGSGLPDLLPDIPFVGENGTLDIRDGLPSGTEVKSIIVIDKFFNISRAAGGALGGGITIDSGTATLTMKGTGDLGGYVRKVSTPVIMKWEKQIPDTSKPVISVDTRIDSLFAEITGDPDFDTLRIRSGTDFGLPSPGHTTLTSLPDSTWNVDSFFDVAYEIEFVGAPGGALDGLSGITTDTVRIRQGTPVLPPPLRHFGEINHYPLGEATLDTNPEGHLVVGNIGSSGNDGVSIELPDDPTFDNGAYGFSLRVDSTTTFDTSAFMEYRLLAGEEAGDTASPSGQYISFRVSNLGVDSMLDLWVTLHGFDDPTYDVQFFNAGLQVGSVQGLAKVKMKSAEFPVVFLGRDRNDPSLTIELRRVGIMEITTDTGKVTEDSVKSVTVKCYVGMLMPKTRLRTPFTVEEGYTAVQVLAGNIPELIIEEEHTVPEDISQEVSHLTGWNMVSNPAVLDPGEDSVHLVYPDNLFPYVFGFDPGSGYFQTQVIPPGKGYWGKYGSSGTTEVAGEFLPSDTIDVGAGWHMVGSLSAGIQTASVWTDPPGIIASTWFGYSGGYFASSIIEPGKAYWVKTADSGNIYLNYTFSTAPKTGAEEADPADLLHSLDVTDADGNRGKLYFGVDPGNRIDDAETLMPPLPPEGVFDARLLFGGEERYAAVHGAVEADPIRIEVEIRSAIYPVTLDWKVKNPDTEYELRVPGRDPFRMNGEGSMTLDESDVTGFEIVAVSGSGLPSVYALSRNYPNPFNPSTTVNYQLPVGAAVTVDMVDILGRTLSTVLRETLPAGYHRAEWDGTDGHGHPAASGVYFLRLTARGDDGSLFTAIQKVLLMK